MPLRIDERGIPATINEEDRSVEVVATTEAPAEVFDWERWEVVNEVLLMSGMEIPGNKQVPLLDAHNRFETANVIGSFRQMQIEGDRVVGRAFFASAAAADDAYTKVKEGHLTDFSVGYRVLTSQWVPKDESAVIEGETYNGPIKVSTKWRMKELSAVPIGADEEAKVRSDYQPKSNQEDTMDKKTREMLEKRGLSKDATEQEAWDYLDTLTQPGQRAEETPSPSAEPPAQPVNAEAERAEATRAERDRITEINAMCVKFDCMDLAEQLIGKGASIEDARKTIMDQMAERQKDEPQAGYRGPRFDIVADEGDKFKAAAEDSIIIRSGMNIEKPAPGADDLTGYSLIELARHSLRLAGRDTRGRPMDMVGRALTTSDFAYILANVANKSLFAGWDTAEETWSQWCGTGSVTDFKTNYLPRVSEGSALDEIPESREYKYGDRTEAQESFSIATYGKLFAITRQAIINDDLNALATIPAMHGEAASRKIGDVAYAVLSGNAAMGDSIALFHASHSNLVASGSGAAPGIATIAAAVLAMGTQKDLQGLRRLNIRPLFFIGPKAIEGAAEVFFRTEKFVDSDTVATDSSLAATRVNPYSGTYLKRIYDGRIDDDVATKWYLAANKGRTVNVYFLDGIQKPYLETKEGWAVDGVEYKVRIDVGAKAVDWKGLYQNYGA